MSSTLNGRKFSKGGASIISSYCVDQLLWRVRISTELRILENLVANVMFTNFRLRQLNSTTHLEDHHHVEDLGLLGAALVC